MEDDLTVTVVVVESDQGAKIMCSKCAWVSDAAHYRSYMDYGRQLVRLMWHTEDKHPKS